MKPLQRVLFPPPMPDPEKTRALLLWRCLNLRVLMLTSRGGCYLWCRVRDELKRYQRELVDLRNSTLN